MTDTQKLEEFAEGGLRTTALFGWKLQPYQQRMVDMMLSLPEGAKWRLIIGRGRLSGSYGEKDGKLTHQWDGKEWVSLPNADVDLPDTAAQDSASKLNSPAVSG